jgi:thiol-disulfide isomerase/thioredoxin
LCLALSLWGCDESRPRRGGAGGRALSTADVVAELLDENKPFEFDFDLKDVDGNRLSKSDFEGKVLIVDIWGTWCPPCRMEIPHFVALDRTYREKGLRIVGLNYEHDDDAADAAKHVRQFRSAEGVSYPCALATPNVIRQVPDFEGFPTTLFIDHTGRVRLKIVGYNELPFLQAAVEALLKEMPPAQGAAADEAEPADDAGEKPTEN